MTKPGIIVRSEDSEDSFRWLSDGWFEMAVRNTPEAQELMAKAHQAIEEGTDVPDVCKRLEAAGFEVKRQPGPGTGFGF